MHEWFNNSLQSRMINILWQRTIVFIVWNIEIFCIKWEKKLFSFVATFSIFDIKELSSFQWHWFIWRWTFSKKEFNRLLEMAFICNLFLIKLCEVIFSRFSQNWYTQISFFAKYWSIFITSVFPFFKKRFYRLVLVMIALEIHCSGKVFCFILNNVSLEVRLYQ